MHIDLDTKKHPQKVYLLLLALLTYSSQSLRMSSWRPLSHKTVLLVLKLTSYTIILLQVKLMHCTTLLLSVKSQFKAYETHCSKDKSPLLTAYLRSRMLHHNLHQSFLFRGRVTVYHSVQNYFVADCRLLYETIYFYSSLFAPHFPVFRIKQIYYMII